MSAAGETVSRPVRDEMMRIAGERVDGETGKRIEVRYPFTNEVIGTVPRASREQVSRAFDIAASYRPKLSR